MQILDRHINPCANPGGIKNEKSDLSEITTLTYFPKFLEFSLKSTATSKIFPCVTVIIFAWDLFV